MHGEFCHPSRMYFDACIELPLPLGSWGGKPLPTETITGGVHLSGACVFDYAAIAPAIAGLRDDPLIGHGLSIADDRPAIITYERQAKAAGRRAWSFTLNMPLCWANQMHERAA